MRKSRKTVKKLKKDIERLEKERKGFVRLLLSEQPLMEGSFFHVLVKCGKPGCHCQKKPIHAVTKLSWYENGKLKNKIVRIADRQRVERLTNAYKAHKTALANIDKIHKIEKTFLKVAIKWKSDKYM